MVLVNGLEDSETREVQNVSAAPNVPELVWPILQSEKKVEKGFVTVNIMETRRTQGIKTL
jgi:hypothetical protein